jgi:hypothetical protein
MDRRYRYEAQTNEIRRLDPVRSIRSGLGRSVGCFETLDVPCAHRMVTSGMIREAEVCSERVGWNRLGVKLLVRDLNISLIV